MVHEGDITRASRPRGLRYNKVDRAAIATDVDWIEQLMNSIEAVVNEDENSEH